MSIEISEQTWSIEKHLAERSLDVIGILPTGTDPGGRFWTLIDQRYENAVNTGHLERFLLHHCAFVDRVETERHRPRPGHPGTPGIPSVPEVPSGPMVPIVPPACVITPPPGNGEHPVPVPEMSSLSVVVAIVAIAMLIRLIAGRYGEGGGHVHARRKPWQTGRLTRKSLKKSASLLISIW